MRRSFLSAPRALKRVRRCRRCKLRYYPAKYKRGCCRQCRQWWKGGKRP